MRAAGYGVPSRLRIRDIDAMKVLSPHNDALSLLFKDSSPEVPFTCPAICLLSRHAPRSVSEFFRSVSV